LPGRILHVLAQRPALTGSGVTLEAHVRHAAAVGWSQRVLVGVPVDEPRPPVDGFADAAVATVTFGPEGDLPFPVPGMSDVMPYASSRWSTLSDRQLEDYRDVWRTRLRREVEGFHPGVIQSHHVWVVSALVKEVAPELPVAVMVHATGLRQLQLCPHLAEAVIEGCRRCDRFLVLHAGHARELRDRLDVPADRIRTVGAGFREDLFHARGRPVPTPPHVVYIGKLSHAKGLPWLLDAWRRVAARRPDARLHVCGSGTGDEAEALAGRIASLAPSVIAHGQQPQAVVAEILRSCRACVLPSFYEGLPLVLAEAAACGCRLVATALPGIVEELAPHLGWAMQLVPPPDLQTVDRPVPSHLPAFVDRLERAIDAALDGLSPLVDPERLRASLAPFTWSAVCARVEEVWRRIRKGDPPDHPGRRGGCS
jgi:glycosyltransferase involved in cell wall biosynthesis